MYRDLNDFPIFQALKDKNIVYAEKIRKIYDFTEKYLNEIHTSGLFEGYTDHSIKHSLKIICYMQQLMKIIELSDGYKYNARDLYYAIAAALLHDIGMVISREDTEAYLQGTTSDENFNINQIFAFKEFKTSKEKEAAQIDYLTAYIRKNHGKRSSKLIKESTAEIYKIINNQQDATNIACICESHCMSIEAAITNFFPFRNPVKQLGGGEVHSCLYIALILRIADALDISEERVPNIVRNLRGIDTRIENKSHWDMNAAIDAVLLIQEKDYLDAPNDDSLKVQVDIKNFDLFKMDSNRKTDDETILKAAYYETLSDVTQYFLMVRKELMEAKKHSIRIAYNNTTLKSYKQYFIDISTSIKFIPEPSYESHIVNMNYKTVLVNLLGNGLYGDSRVGLREIVQNSIDAIRWKNSSNQGQFIQNKIIITIDANKDFVSIADNGIGMDKTTITDCLLGIGKSIYNTEGFRISNSQFQHIGYYGIGFFSVFMLCDSVTINSRKANGPLTSITINDTNSNYFSETINPQDAPFFEHNISGTEIVLHGINKFKKAFAYLQIADQPDTSEQCYGEAVQHYLELLFLNDNKCKIDFIINEILDHEPSSNIDGITDKKFSKICDISSLDSTSRHYFKQDNIVETLVEYTGKSYRSIYQWDGEKFEEISDWHDLEIEDDKSVDVCTMTDWNNNNLILLFVPTKYLNDPFELGVTNYRQRVFYEEQAIIGSYTVRQLITDTGIQPLIQDKNYCIAVIEKMLFKRLATNTILYKRNAFFEESAPLSAIKSGREYLDKIYVRNVLVPGSHLCLPIVLVGYNNHFSDEIQNIIINVLSRNVIPNIKREDLDDNNLKITSRMVAKLLIDYTNISEHEKNIIKSLMED